MDIEEIRNDFPVLAGCTYLDSACMSLKPRQVIDKMNEYYIDYPACAGRSMHSLSKKTEDEYDGARKKIARFISAKRDEIVFTRNTTEAINLLVSSLKAKSVISTDKEHNSNLVPWLVYGAERKIVNTNGGFDIGQLEKYLDEGAEVVSVVHASNIDGSVTPIEKITKIAHKAGVKVIIDAAQSVPHMPFSTGDADFICFSGHKMAGPSIGVLYGKKKLLEQMEPYQTGGDTVSETTYTSYKLLKPPEKFEAGLQNYAGAIGLGAAADYLSGIGMKNVQKQSESIIKLIKDNLSGTADVMGTEGSIYSFNVKGMDMHSVALMLSEQKIMVRSGQHCVHSWFNSKGIKGCVRASSYFYNSEQDAEKFCNAIRKLRKMKGNA